MKIIVQLVHLHLNIKQAQTYKQNMQFFAIFDHLWNNTLTVTKQYYLWQLTKLTNKYLRLNYRVHKICDYIYVWHLSTAYAIFNVIAVVSERLRIKKIVIVIVIIINDNILTFKSSYTIIRQPFIARRPSVPQQQSTNHVTEQ